MKKYLFALLLLPLLWSCGEDDIDPREKFVGDYTGEMVFTYYTAGIKISSDTTDVSMSIALDTQEDKIIIDDYYTATVNESTFTLDSGLEETLTITDGVSLDFDVSGSGTYNDGIVDLNFDCSTSYMGIAVSIVMECALEPTSTKSTLTPIEQLKTLDINLGN